jgi:hypothetical protein
VCGAIAAAAARGTACLTLGRDPALRAIAERDGWRQLALVHGALRPLSQIALDSAALDELLVEAAAAPMLVPAAVPDRFPHGDNVVPFPLRARTAGAR